MIHNPSDLSLDEPTASLAPESAKVVREQILKLAKTEKRTFFICTHNLFEAERLATRVGIINRGQLITQGSPAELRELRKDESYTIFRFSDWNDLIRNHFQENDYEILEINPNNKSVKLFISDIEKETPLIIENLVNHKFPMFEVKHQFPTLERVYLELVENANRPRNDQEEEL